MKWGGAVYRRPPFFLYGERKTCLSADLDHCGRRGLLQTARMMLNVPRLGLLVGGLMAGLHAFWVLLVATGWAQPLLDLIFWLHFVTPPYRVEAFEPVRAAVLVIVTGSLGFLGGAVLAFVWNRAGPGQA
jgi:hypothetical protein